MNEKKKMLTVIGVIALAIIILVFATVIDKQNQNKFLKQFDSYFNSKEEKLVYIGRPTCSYCNLTKPVLDELAEANKFKYLYVNIDELGESVTNSILTDLKVNSSEFGTPYLAIVKEGKVVASHPGYGSEDVLFEFLQKNNVINKDAKLALNYITYDKYKEIVASNTKTLVVAITPTNEYDNVALKGLKEIAAKEKLAINVLNINSLKEDQYKEFIKSLPYLEKLATFTTPLSLVIENKDAVNSKLGFTTTEDYLNFLNTIGIK